VVSLNNKAMINSNTFGSVLNTTAISKQCSSTISSTMGSESSPLNGSTIDVPMNSGVPQTEHIASMGHQIQTTQFDNASESLSTQPSMADPTFKMDKIDTGQLSDFLSRPTLVQSVSWLQGTPFGSFNLPVWTFFFQSPSIKRKIENYSFFQGEIHIKLMVNSSPFNYGAMIAAYEPLVNHGYNVGAAANITANRICEYSQFPHVWILPASNQGGEIVFPFFYDLDWLDLTKASEVGAMGTLRLWEVDPLDTANGSVGQEVDIQIYVWFEKVELSGLTHKAPLQMGLMSDIIDRAPQMWKAATAKSADEYAKRPVSSIAGTVAAVASPLTSVPGIGIFAKATQLGASAVSKIASIFGWTNPPNIANVEPVRQAPYHGFASSAISVPGDTLSLDPKAELSVDPRTVGLGDVDELAVSNLVQREAYIGAAIWATGDATNVTLLAVPVHCCHYVVGPNVNNGDEVSFAPIGLLNQTFGYWRGDIIFRFKMICTVYHRGRIRFTWDPMLSLFGSSANNNTALNRIVDLSMEQDVEIRIPYNQARHWLATRSMLPIGSVPYLRVKGQTFVDYVDDETTNGMLTCSVLNSLSAPDPGANVRILIFVRGAPNMEFCVPKTPLSRNFSYFAPQSGEVSISGHSEDNTNQQQYNVYFGDPVRSLRTVLRRAHPNVSLNVFNNTVPGGYLIKWVSFTNTIFPYFNGYDPTSNFTAASLVTGTKPYSFAVNTPFHMWIPCFKGMRGSMYWHYEHSKCNNTPERYSLEIRRGLNDPRTDPDRLVWTELEVGPITGTGSQVSRVEAASFDALIGETRSAATLVSPFNGEGKSVLFPNQFNYRFDTTRVSAMVTGLNRPRKRRENVSVMMRFFPIATNPNDENNSFIRRYFSIGPDFTVFFFLCVPRVYRYTTIPLGA